MYRANLGRIVRAAQGRGLWFVVFTRGRCLMAPSERDLGWEGIGATPEEAAARAFWAAMADEKPHSATEPMHG